MREKEFAGLKPVVLPKRIEQALDNASWQRDVLVGCLRNKQQLRTCLHHGFYHMPAERLEGDAQSVKWIAIYQSQTLFGRHAGVRYYGRVTGCKLLPRNQIPQIPRDSDTPYYVFYISQWQKLRRKIRSKELPVTHLRTTEFLLQNSTEVPELMVEDARQFRLYRGLRKLLCRPRLRPAGFLFEDAAVVLTQGEVGTIVDGKWTPSYLQRQYADAPSVVFSHILSQLPEP